MCESVKLRLSDAEQRTADAAAAALNGRSIEGRNREALEARVAELSGNLDAAAITAQEKLHELEHSNSLLREARHKLAEAQASNDILKQKVDEQSHTIHKETKKIKELEQRISEEMRKHQDQGVSQSGKNSALEQTLKRKERMIKELEAELENLQTLLDRTIANRDIGMRFHCF